MSVIVAHKERTHALCSASAADRWLNCPGSVALSHGLPDQPPSEYALEGTRAHELAERILRKWLDDGRRLNAAWVDSLRPEYEDTINSGAVEGWTMVDYVMTYVNLCLDVVESFDQSPAPPVVKIEHRLILDENLAMFGTLDLACTGRRNGMWAGAVVDLKYGRGKSVTAFNNRQGLFYACSLKANSKKPLEEVLFRIVQPRVERFMSDWFISEQDLVDGAKMLKAGAETAISQLMGLKPRELKRGGWCWFCPAKHVCPEMDKARMEKAKEDFEDIPL